jgi:hypothetical protein
VLLMAMAKSVAVSHTGDFYLHVPRHAGESDDYPLSVISRSGNIATCCELRRNSSAQVWRVAMLATRCP